MEDKVLFNHPSLGTITFQDLINDFELMLTDISYFEDIIYNYLKEYTDMSDEDISTIFDLSITDRLKWIIFILKSS